MAHENGTLANLRDQVKQQLGALGGNTYELRLNNAADGHTHRYGPLSRTAVLAELPTLNKWCNRGYGVELRPAAGALIYADMTKDGVTKAIIDRCGPSLIVEAETGRYTLVVPGRDTLPEIREQLDAAFTRRYGGRAAGWVSMVGLRTSGGPEIARQVRIEALAPRRERTVTVRRSGGMRMAR